MPKQASGASEKGGLQHMRGNDLLDKMALIDPAYIEAADIAPRIRKHRSIKRWAAIAACFVLLLSIGMGTLIYAAEVKE